MGSSHKHFIYILKCSDDSFYTGYATDVLRRIREHNGQEKKAGAKYTAARRPVRLVYSECFTTRAAAMQREAAIKKLTRTQKQALLLRNAQSTSDKKKKPGV